MTSEFSWWLLILGLVIGAALVWLVLADFSRRESEISEEELPREAAWIAASLGERGRNVQPEVAEEVLRLHRAYLASLPPDDEESTWEDEVVEEAPGQRSDEATERDDARGSASAIAPDWVRGPGFGPESPVSPRARLPREGQPSQGRNAGT